MRPPRGFTLLELAVVTAILAVVIAVVYPRFSSMSPRSGVKEASLRLASVAAIARDLAVCSGCPYQLHISREQGTYWVTIREPNGLVVEPLVGLGLKGRLPEDVHFGEIGTAIGQSTTPKACIVEFNPMGRADAATIQIVGIANRNTTISIEPWSGEVRIDEP
jgi:prepilin-type N-terminal cleavage/methylation domain-containing protein